MATSIILLANFTVSAYAVGVFTTNMIASLRVVDIRDDKGNLIVPFGDPLVDSNYLSIQGDFEADRLSPPLLQQDVTGEGTVLATGTSQVFAHGVEQTVDIAGDPLGNGAIPDVASPLFFPLGAAFVDSLPGLGAVPGINSALLLNGSIKQTAIIHGSATTGTALASVNPASWVFIDNSTNHDLTISLKEYMDV